MNKKLLVIGAVIVVLAIIIYLLVRDTSCKDLVQDGKCVKTCSQGYYKYLNTCVKNCPSFQNGDKCVSVCDNQQFIDGKICVNSCPSGIADGKICVVSCPSGKRNENGICKPIPSQLDFEEVKSIDNGLGINTLEKAYNGLENDLYFSPNTENLITFKFNDGPYYLTNFFTKINISNPLVVNTTSYTHGSLTEEGKTVSAPSVLTLYDLNDNIIYKKEDFVRKEDQNQNDVIINHTFSPPLNLEGIKYKLYPFSYIYDIQFFGRKSA